MLRRYSVASMICLPPIAAREDEKSFAGESGGWFLQGSTAGILRRTAGTLCRLPSESQGCRAAASRPIGAGAARLGLGVHLGLVPARPEKGRVVAGMGEEHAVARSAAT